MAKLQQMAVNDIQMEPSLIDLPDIPGDLIEETMSEVIKYDRTRVDMQPSLWVYYPNRHNKGSASSEQLQIIEKMGCDEARVRLQGWKDAVRRRTIDTKFQCRMRACLYVVVPSFRESGSGAGRDHILMDFCYVTAEADDLHDLFIHDIPQLMVNDTLEKMRSVARELQETDSDHLMSELYPDDDHKNQRLGGLEWLGEVNQVHVFEKGVPCVLASSREVPVPS